MMAENSKVYDVLYKLSYLNNKNIHKRIRNLLHLMPSDIRILIILILYQYVQLMHVQMNDDNQLKIQ